MTAKKLCRIALMAALICAVAPLEIPTGAVPVTLATLMVYLAGALLGAKCGAMAVGLYLMIGALGLPVFSGFTGGLQQLATVSGGYLIGYLPCAWLTGYLKDRIGVPAAMILGTIACYTLGTAWFIMQTGTGVAAALALCVLPFLPGDAAKIALAAMLAKRMKVD